MSEHDRQDYTGLSEQELQGQEAHTLPDREVMSLLSGTSTLLPIDGSGIDPLTYPDTGAAGGSNLNGLPAYNTADTNSVQNTTSATDSATS